MILILHDPADRGSVTEINAKTRRLQPNTRARPGNDLFPCPFLASIVASLSEASSGNLVSGPEDSCGGNGAARIVPEASIHSRWITARKTQPTTRTGSRLPLWRPMALRPVLAGSLPFHPEDAMQTYILAVQYACSNSRLLRPCCSLLLDEFQLSIRLAMERLDIFQAHPYLLPQYSRSTSCHTEF